MSAWWGTYRCIAGKGKKGFTRCAEKVIEGKLLCEFHLERSRSGKFIRYVAPVTSSGLTKLK